MTRTVTTSVARIGNSNAIIVPKDFLRLLHLEPRDKVEITRSDDGLFIKPVPKWTQEAQANAARKFINSIINSPSTEEPLPENFVEEFRFSGREFNETLFSGLEDNN